MCLFAIFGVLDVLLFGLLVMAMAMEVSFLRLLFGVRKDEAIAVRWRDQKHRDFGSLV